MKALVRALGIMIAMGLLGRAAARPAIPEERIPGDAAPEVRRYIEQLYSRDAVTRAMGAVALGRMGDRAEPAVPFLLSMLEDEVKLEWEVRDAEPATPLEEAKKRLLGFYKERETSPGREAARAVARICIAPPPALFDALRDKSPAARRHAAEALGGIRDKKATEPLTALLRDEDKEVRSQAARALGRLRDTAATDALVAALKDPERSVRRDAVAALGEIKDPRALQAILDALLDTVEVREAAEAVLLETRDLRAVEPLVVSLRHRKEEVRRISARLLAAIGDPRAIRPLILALKDTAADVRFEASTALKKLTGEDFGADPDKWQRWHELFLASKEIEEHLAGDRVHAYIGSLHSPNWAARAYAAKALGDLGDRRAATALRGALWDRDAGVRRNAAVALGQVGDPQAVESLIAAVSDAEPEVQEAADEALRRITGARIERDSRKWQEWWDENRDSVFARDREKEGEAPPPEEIERRVVEEAPQRPAARSGSFILLIVLASVAIFPVVALIFLRVIRRR